MGPVDAALQLELVVGLDVEKQVLVEADASDQVCPVGAFQGASAVDVLRGGGGGAVLSSGPGYRPTFSSQEDRNVTS